MLKHILKQMKIPRSVRKKIKHDARIESGIDSVSKADVAKSKEKAERKNLFRTSTVGQAIGKIAGRGKYNLIPQREGGGLDAKIPNEPPPLRPKLKLAGFKHSKFSSVEGEDESQRFEVKDTNALGLVKKARDEQARVKAKDIGTDEQIVRGLEPIFDENKDKQSKYNKLKAAQHKYETGDRTDEMSAKKEKIKARNDKRSNRLSYKTIKKYYKDEYRNQTPK